MRAAVVRADVVENVVELPDGWTGKPGEWTAPTGTSIVGTTQAGPKWTYDGVTFTTPPAPPAPPPLPDPNAALKTKIDAALADALISQKVKDVLAEWRTKL